MKLRVDGGVARGLMAVVLAGGFIAPAWGLPPAPLVPSGASANSGPSADYPVVVGPAYNVGNTVFTPVNVMNYDAVGYASVGAGAGVSAAHHTLPLPSYVEVTSLVSGRTILVRVERRGPMDSTHAIELSAAAAAQLGIGSDGRAAVRVRRVNPPEAERAALRSGGYAPERMATPKPLLVVLQRRMDADPMAKQAGASLAQNRPTPPSDDTELPPVKPRRAPVVAAAKAPAANIGFTPIAVAEPKPVVHAPPPAPKPAPVASPPGYYPPAAWNSALAQRPAPLPVPSPAPRKAIAQAAPAKPIALEARVAAPVAHTVAGGSVVVQIGAFSDKARASAVARKASAHVFEAGNLWRVRMGPYSSRGEAEAALAKAKANGYTEARIQRGD
jgi:rare lipoprotein A